MKKFTSWLFMSILTTLMAQTNGLVAQTNNDSTTKTGTPRPPGLYANFHVKNFVIVSELYYKQVPLTITSFVGLATGKFDGHVTKKGQYFDGLSFHRVIDNFVVQGGDPKGNGTGGPGYKFIDEFDGTLRHNKKGILSMANSGPNTNGSQFFITLAPTPHLDNVHSVFGSVIEGEEFLDKIVQGDKIKSLEISAEGDEAKAFLDAITWNNFSNMMKNKMSALDAQAKKEKETMLTTLRADTKYTETKEGIFYKVDKEGTGQKVENGDTIAVHYELTLYGSNNIIDSSFKRNTPFELTVGTGSVIPGWEIILQYLKEGEKATVVIPPELGYGESGVGPIPPNSFLQFVIEVIEIKK